VRSRLGLKEAKTWSEGAPGRQEGSETRRAEKVKAQLEQGWREGGTEIVNYFNSSPAAREREGDGTKTWMR